MAVVRFFLVTTFFLAPLFVTSTDAGAMRSWSVRLSSPQILSASGGFLIGDTEGENPDKFHVPLGLLIQAEPGIGGGKIALGVAKGLPPLGGVALKGVVLRTWGKPLWTETGRTYAGGELDAGIFLKISLGVLRRVDGPSGERDTIATGGIGFGF